MSYQTRHGETAAENEYLRGRLWRSIEDVQLLQLRLHLAPFTVPAGPDPRRRIVRRAHIPAPRRP